MRVGWSKMRSMRAPMPSLANRVGEGGRIASAGGRRTARSTARAVPSSAEPIDTPAAITNTERLGSKMMKGKR